MSVYTWITCIAAVTLLIVIILLFRKFLAGKENGLIIFTIILLGILASAALYVFTSMQGTQILSSNLAAEYQMKEETFRTTDENTANYLHAAYAFYAENGVQYQLRGTQLLKEPDASPAFTGIYTCEAVDGYSWCYMKKGTVIRYTLTTLSHDGKEAVQYEAESEKSKKK